MLRSSQIVYVAGLPSALPPASQVVMSVKNSKMDNVGKQPKFEKILSTIRRLQNHVCVCAQAALRCTDVRIQFRCARGVYEQLLRRVDCWDDQKNRFWPKNNISATIFWFFQWNRVNVLTLKIQRIHFELCFARTYTLAYEKKYLLKKINTLQKNDFTKYKNIN